MNTEQSRSTEVTGREVGEIEIRGTSTDERVRWRGTDRSPGLAAHRRSRIPHRRRTRRLWPRKGTHHGRRTKRVPQRDRADRRQIDGVRDGCVVAIGTGEASARPRLVITAEFKGEDEPAARSAVVARVASECGVVPADVVFVKPGALPRTSSGKLRRLEVKRNLEGAQPMTESANVRSRGGLQRTARPGLRRPSHEVDGRGRRERTLPAKAHRIPG